MFRVLEFPEPPPGVMVSPLMLLRRLALVPTITAALGAASAHAAAPITGMYAGPITAASTCAPDGSGAVPSTQGSSRSDFCIAYAVDNPDGPGGDDMKRLIVDTPRGFSGNPDGLPQCSDAQFDYANQTSDVSCPGNSQMGDVRANIRVSTILLGTQSLTNVPGRVFNLQHSGNEVARLGIILDPNFIGIAQPKVKILVRVTFRPNPDLGLRSIIDDLPQTACTQELLASGCGRALATDAFALRFWGSRTDHPSMPISYGMLGSDCSTDQVTTLASTAYDGATSGGTDTYSLTDCASAPFSPTVEYATTENRPDVTTETSVKVKFGVFNDPRVSANPKRTVVTLPEGLTFAGQIASGANGLPLCSPAEFGQFAPEHNSCPAASEIGTVAFTSPVLANPLTGNAYLGQQPAPGELPDVYIEAQLGTVNDAPRIKLVGHLTVDAQNRIVTTIDDLPQQPVTEFALTFRGGDHSALVTPEQCGAYTGALAATPYSSSTAIETTAPYAITDDCAAAGGFAPSIAFTGANPNAGQFGTFTSVVTRADRSERISRVSIDLPPGQLSSLKGVPECSSADATAGTCPAATRIGTVTSTAGVGPAPYTATGDVFLTARPDGAVAGVTLRVPVAFGEVDLGQLNVPARIEIRPDDLGLRFISDVPLRFKGLPLDLRTFTVALDRDRFALNPTNCDVLTTSSTLTSALGTAAAASASYQVAGCGALPFSPGISGAVTGQTTDGARPTVQVRVTNGDGTSALKTSSVTLPAGIAVDLQQTKRACSQAAFAAGTCAATARIGTLTGTLAIADEPLTGDVYILEAPKGRSLPGIGLVFTGRFTGRISGFNVTDAQSRLVSTFPTLPDVPLTQLDLTFASAANSPLLATKELCTDGTVTFTGVFGAQGGQSATKSSSVACGNPLASGTLRASGRLRKVRSGTPTLVLSVSRSDAAKLSTVDVTLPKGYSIASARKSIGSRLIKVATRGAKVTRRSSRTFRVTLPASGATKVRIITRTGTIKIRSSSLRRSKKRVAVSVKGRTKAGALLSAPLRLTPR